MSKSVVNVLLLSGTRIDGVSTKLLDSCETILSRIEGVYVFRGDLCNSAIVRRFPQQSQPQSAFIFKIIILEPYNELMFTVLPLLGFQVYGCHYFLDCLVRNACMNTRWSNISNTWHPIHCNCLQSCNVTITGVHPILKNVIVSLVTLCGGTVTNDLQGDTNYVITGNGLSEKSLVAQSHSIPVVTERWVWLNTQAPCTAKRIERHALSGLFHGVNVCCLNFCAFKHATLPTTVTSRGGRFFDGAVLTEEQYQNMDVYVRLDECDCVEHKTTPDCNTTFNWSYLNREEVGKHPFVTHSWLFESVRTNTLQPFERYVCHEEFGRDYKYQPRLKIILSPTTIPFGQREWSRDQQGVIDFLLSNNQFELLLNGTTPQSQHHVSGSVVVREYCDFLKNCVSPNRDLDGSLINVSFEWLRKCHTLQQMAPIQPFRYTIPEWMGHSQHHHFNSQFLSSHHSEGVIELEKLFINRKCFVSNQFSCSLWLESVDQLKELLLWLGAQLVACTEEAHIVFDHSSIHSKSLFWLESCITSGRELPGGSVSSFYCGFIDPELKTMFHDRVVQVNPYLPGRITRHIAVVVDYCGGLLRWEAENKLTSTIDNLTNVSLEAIEIGRIVMVDDAASLAWFVTCLERKTFSSECPDVLTTLLRASLEATWACEGKDLFVEMKGGFVYLSNTVTGRDVIDLENLVKSMGAQLTHVLSLATHMVVERLDPTSEEQRSAETLKLKLLTVAQLGSALRQNEPAAMKPASPLPTSTVISTLLEESLADHQQLNQKFSILERDIESMLQKSFLNRSLESNDHSHSSALAPVSRPLNYDSVDTALLMEVDQLNDDDNDNIVITYDYNHDDDVKEEENSEEEFRFLLSSLTGERKTYLANVVRELGGVYIDIPTFDLTCTHLVIGDSVAKSEKLLAALASGKVVLHHSYLDASKNAGKFIDYTDYLLNKNCLWVDPIHADVFAHWYIHLKKSQNENKTGSGGAFSGWRAVVCAETIPKQEGFERLLLAGGAIVISINKALEQKSQLAITHAFVEPNASQLSQCIEHFDPYVFTVEYLADYLMLYDDFCPQRYAVSPQIKPRRSTRKRKSIK